MSHAMLMIGYWLNLALECEQGSAMWYLSLEQVAQWGRVAEAERGL